MKIETNFSIDDIVYPIHKGGYNDFVECETCKGTGTVSINNTERSIQCPDCYGAKGKNEWVSEKWCIEIDGASAIGKIDIELYRENGENESRTMYMLDNTGIGSGTCWYENDLFRTKNGAKKECDKRNKVPNN